MPPLQSIFDMGASGYANIAQQVRSVEFEAELTRRLEERDAAHAQAVELAKATLLRTTAEEAARPIRNWRRSRRNSKRNAPGRAKAIELEVTKAEGTMHQTLSELREKVNQSDLQRQLTERNLTAQHKAALDAKDEIIRLREEEIELRKDMKMRLSTKMLGETLEQRLRGAIQSDPRLSRTPTSRRTTMLRRGPKAITSSARPQKRAWSSSRSCSR